MRDVLAEVAAAGTPVDAVRHLPGLDDFFTTVGLPEALDLGERIDHD